VAQIDNTLNDAFGQRQVGVIYNPLNQYRVVMEASPSTCRARRRCAASSSSTARASRCR
jgi:multidrug efflux pump subunit AcrB